MQWKKIRSDSNWTNGLSLCCECVLYSIQQQKRWTTENMTCSSWLQWGALWCIWTLHFLLTTSIRGFLRRLFFGSASLLIVWRPVQWNPPPVLDWGLWRGIDLQTLRFRGAPPKTSPRNSTSVKLIVRFLSSCSALLCGRPPRGLSALPLLLDVAQILASSPCQRENIQPALN